MQLIKLKNIRIFHLLFLLLILISCKSIAQMIPFTQNYSAPLMVNPANNGLFNGRASFQSNFKSQWGSIAYPYVTGVLNGEVRILDNFIGKDDIAAIGILGIYDKSNDGGFKQTQFGGNIAFHKALDYTGSLRLGIGAQMSYRSYLLDYSKLTFQSQFAPYIGYSNPSFPSGEGFGYSTNLFDYGAGLLLSYLETDFSYYLGVAGAHLNSPTSSNNSLSFNIPPAITFHGGFSSNDKNENHIYGSFTHTRSSATNYTTMGLIYGRNLNGYIDEDGDELQIGSFLRFKDAFAPYIGYKKGNLSAGLSYDISMTDLAIAKPGTGSLELNLKVMILDDPNNASLKKIKCKFILW